MPRPDVPVSMRAPSTLASLSPFAIGRTPHELLEGGGESRNLLR